jgi:transposase
MSSYARVCALQLLRDLGIPLPPTVRGGRPSAFTAAMEREVIARLQRGDRQGAIAADFGVCRQTVNRLVRRARRTAPETFENLTTGET